MAAKVDEWVYFVHGTTTGEWKSTGLSGEIKSIGKGDFGLGFYTFEDSSWGRQSASSWANLKAKKDGSKPLLIRLRMSVTDFSTLNRKDIADKKLAEIHRKWYPDKLTSFELVVGPVAKRDINGKRVPNRDYPTQFKFEGNGVLKLTYDTIEYLK